MVFQENLYEVCADITVSDVNEPVLLPGDTENKVQKLVDTREEIW